MKAYHFLQSDWRAGEGNEPAWEVGETRTIDGSKEIGLCEYGYHSSPTLWDALQYAPGPIACLVDISAPIEQDGSKAVSRRRTLIKAVHIERELRLFAADCAARVLYLFEREYPHDDRARQAIQAARDFANGKITREQSAAAGRAARAAGDAAWAAGNTARAARSAAWAAGDAAWDTARATGNATWAAARATWAAGKTTWAVGHAARATELKWQRQHFDEMFKDVFIEEHK